MRTRTVIAWLPIATMPAAEALFAPGHWPRWEFMWVFAFTIYIGCKWLTWQMTPSGAVARQIGYLTLWPGLDADTFLHMSNPGTPSRAAWCFALAKFLAGLFLLGSTASEIPREDGLIRGWVGMIGLLFVLHFGLFDLLSLGWQSLGVTAKPLMNWPMFATSLSDFWGQRWNTAFRDLTHRFLFRPLTSRFGARTALCIGFLFSGVVHDLVISLPARGGYGGPTAFFLLQSGGIFLERSTLGKRLGLGNGVRGWGFTMLMLLGPIFLLFHPPFVHRVVLPFLDAIARFMNVG